MFEPLDRLFQLTHVIERELPRLGELRQVGSLVFSHRLLPLAFDGIDPSCILGQPRARDRQFLLLLDDLLLRLNYGYLQPRYDEFIDNDPNTGEPQDVRDNRAFPLAPEHTAGAGLDWTVSRLRNGTVRLSLDADYTDRYYLYPYALDADTARPDHYLFEGASLPLERDLVTVAFRNGAALSTETREFWRTPLGPVIHRDSGKVYVLRAAGEGDYRAGEQFLRMMRARSLAEWQDAMRMRARINSNFTYADRAGNIFYVWNASIPALPHASGGDTSAIPARATGDVWTRYVPFDSLPQLLNAESQNGTKRGFKSVIMIYLCGAPPHQDMWDIKTDAPADIRGEFKPIKTKVPGIEICELFPRLASIADRLTFIRSMVGCKDRHYAVQCLTGHHNDNQPPGGWPAMGALTGAGFSSPFGQSSQMRAIATTTRARMIQRVDDFMGPSYCASVTHLPSVLPHAP